MKEKAIYTSVMVFWLLATYTVFHLFDEKEAYFIWKEDGIVEWVGALALFLVALFFLAAYLKSNRGNDFKFFRTGRNLFYLLLSVLFFVGFGEEISWGQRMMGIETPEYIKSINRQDEINIHNLVFFSGLLDGNRLLTYFWFGFCCFIPVLYELIGGVRTALDRIGLPVVPLFFSAVFIFNYLLSKGSQLFLADRSAHYLVELKETNISFLFLMIGIWFLRSNKLNANTAGALPQ